MESYSTETIKACTCEEAWWEDSSAIFADCVVLGSSIIAYQLNSFKYFSKEANEVTYELARSCFCNDLSCIWVDEFSDFILCKSTNDVTIVGN
jgi:hypothetical protein